MQNDNTTFVIEKKRLALQVAAWMCWIPAIVLIFTWSWQVGLALLLAQIGNYIDSKVWPKQ